VLASGIAGAAAPVGTIGSVAPRPVAYTLTTSPALGVSPSEQDHSPKPPEASARSMRKLQGRAGNPFVPRTKAGAYASKVIEKVALAPPEVSTSVVDPGATSTGN
jgi:hypothetical protein